MAAMASPIVSARGLSKRYTIPHQRSGVPRGWRGWLRGTPMAAAESNWVLDDVSFALKRQEILGVVPETRRIRQIAQQTMDGGGVLRQLSFYLFAARQPGLDVPDRILNPGCGLPGRSRNGNAKFSRRIQIQKQRQDQHERVSLARARPAGNNA